jgi:PmbA protein
MVRFSNNEVTVVDTLRHRSGSIFVDVDGRKASTNVVELDMASLKKAARKAVAIARSSPPADLHVPLPTGPFSYDPALLRSPRVRLDPDAPVSWVQEAVAAGLKEGATRMAGSLIVHDGEHTLATSGGVLATTEGGSIELSVRAFGKGQASGAAVSLSVDEEGLRAAATGAEVGREARLAGEPAQGEPGVMDAVLGPMVMASVANQVGRMSSAFHIDTGMSFLANKLGENVASRAFTLFDDPTMAGTYGSVPFDAEGLPTQRTAIIEDGVFKSYLHNTTTAQKHGAVSTANAGLIAPRPFNLVMSGGTKDLDSLIASVDRGILVTNCWYLRFQNYATGDFSTIPRDAMFLIRNGELVGSIKELRITGNMLQMLRDIEDATEERKWVSWWEVSTPSLVPHALVRNVNFTQSAR